CAKFLVDSGKIGDLKLLSAEIPIFESRYIDNLVEMGREPREYRISFSSKGAILWGTLENIVKLSGRDKES
ncbi:hypothetical protein V2J09_016670, partial [Rumex salicifolius]